MEGANGYAGVWINIPPLLQRSTRRLERPSGRLMPESSEYRAEVVPRFGQHGRITRLIVLTSEDYPQPKFR